MNRVAGPCDCIDDPLENQCVPDSEPSDETLAIRCQLGDQQAWELLIRRWHPKLWRFVTCMVSNQSTAEDILQTIWMRVVRSLVRLRDPERLPSWLYRIARVAVADQLRARYRQPATEIMVDISDDDDSEHWLETAEEIQSGLAYLHPFDREAIVLHYLEGRSVAEVAEVCGTPPGTVKSRLSRARRILRLHIEK